MHDRPIRAPAGFQFSLQALLVLVGILACLSWPTVHLIRAWSQRSPKFSGVSGLVLIDGAPLEHAVVGFHAVDGVRSAAFGMTDSQGKSKLTTYVSPMRIIEGVRPGTYIVTVQKSRQLSSSNPPPSLSIGAIPPEQVRPELRDYRPGKYDSASTSKLKVTVVDGAKNSFTFSLDAD